MAEKQATKKTNPLREQIVDEIRADKLDFVKFDCRGR